MDETRFKLTDVGTRYLHYRQLLDLWEFGLDILVKYDSSLSEMRRTELEAGIKLLRKQIDVMGDYDPWENKGIIDSIPKNPEDIKD